MIDTSEILVSKTHIEPLRDDGYVIYPVAYISPVVDGKRSAYSKGGNIKPMGSGNTYITNIINNNYSVSVIVGSGLSNVIELPFEPQDGTVAVYCNGDRQMPDTYTVNPDNTVTLNFIFYEGDTILIDGIAVSTHGTLYNQIPTGLINGENKQFTLTKTPLAVRPYKNGKRLDPPEYTLTATGYETTRAPDEGDTMLCDFDY